VPKRWLLLSLSFLLVFTGCVGQHPAQKQSIIVTIDLCQSHRPFEKKLFETLAAIGKRQGRPVPVAVAISGGWIRRHQAELSAIKKLYLNITWVNHSFTHPVENDFLNNPKVDFRHEVLANIELMKQNGLTPSKYFRFPGLRHNAQRLAQLKALGYTNLDADAWLAKGQPIKNGSIILIHGNGNEDPGVVDKFIAYLLKNESRLEPVALPR